MTEFFFRPWPVGIKDDRSFSLVAERFRIDLLERRDEVGLAGDEEGRAVIGFREPIDPDGRAAL